MLDNQENKITRKRVLSILGTVLTVLICILSAVVLINIIVCKVKNKPISFFGTSFAIVQTWSMEPEIMTGDLIVFHSCDYDDVKVGDVIVFVADENFPKIVGKTVVHKVIAIEEEGIRTFGVNNSKPDGGFREKNELLGICTYNSATWGKIFVFLGKYGIFFILAIIAIPFIIRQAIKITKLSKDKNVENDTPYTTCGGDDTPPTTSGQDETPPNT